MAPVACRRREPHSGDHVRRHDCPFACVLVGTGSPKGGMAMNPKFKAAVAAIILVLSFAAPVAAQAPTAKQPLTAAQQLRTAAATA
jgi:hypothetical protein